jgi:hypothetical protein
MDLFGDMSTPPDLNSPTVSVSFLNLQCNWNNTYTPNLQLTRELEHIMETWNVLTFIHEIEVITRKIIES